MMMMMTNRRFYLPVVVGKTGVGKTGSIPPDDNDCTHPISPGEIVSVVKDSGLSPTSTLPSKFIEINQSSSSTSS